MDALIMSCGTGGGHNAAAAAIAEELERRGHNVTVLNPFTLVEGSVSSVIDNTYISVAKYFPRLFGLIYSLGAGVSRLPIPSPVYLANGMMNETMEKYLSEHHFDIIVMSHLFPGEILTNMKRHGASVPKTVFIATDYTCIPFTEEVDCDYCVIPSAELTEEYVRRGVPRERIYPLGIPVRSEFADGHDVGDRDALCRGLGLDPERRYILVTGGSMGAGKLRLVVDMLDEHYKHKNVSLIVVCGSNEKLYEKISAEYGDRHIVIGHTDQMAHYMAVCDVFITKPGGLSSTEAAVSGTPVIHITPIPGCESYNMRFFEAHGMSIAVPSPRRNLIEACDALDDETARETMSENQRKVIPANAPRDICDLIEKAVADADAEGGVTSESRGAVFA